MAAPLLLRAAGPDDVPLLLELWGDAVRPEDGQVDLGEVVERSLAGGPTRVVVAEHDGDFAGAVLLQLTTISPLNLTPVVHIVSPTVREEFRRRGVGRSLIEAGVAFAEENDVPQVSTASLSTSRDANRFMARLGLATRASLRLAPTTAVRARINAMRPTMTRPAGRQQLTHVLAARRSARRQAPTPRAG
ncbi:GNAT family N-acetyltransferase [Nocardioides sp. ChNu-153]|uniref:GNAT family N-acetyltransferase n=1 Tax=unclassified Nocardioides TaxID=2615069 RepID=UPI002405A704|nr:MULTISPECIES: GNAT family N-acetyltransferase [unclassified Nocardioides]MDF9715611.1 GNAT family N-acetyltransferase [Nocardioides sp. ChNu-99]MDN7121283.1 GNAT family N-acetyltransferase [Nocardioides sp. ChNu-153]